MQGVADFWQAYGPILTGGAVIISAFSAILILISNRTIARKRATLDLIMHIESDKELIDARQHFIEIKKSAMRSSTYGTEDQRACPEAETIRKILNINELTAVSIQEGVISESVFRRWFNSAFIDDYKTMTGYIEATRRWKNAHVFEELESLATRWEKTNAEWYAGPSLFNRKIRAMSEVWRA